MASRTAARTALVAAAWVLGGCFGGGGGEGGEAQPGHGSGGSIVPPSTQLSEVTEAQLDELCVANVENIRALNDPEYDCTERALSDSGSPEECAAMRDSCIAQRGSFSDADPCGDSDSGGSGTDPSGGSSSGGDPSLSECTLTVSALESCLGQLAGWYRALSCDAGETPPPSCVEEVDSLCPGLFGSDSDSGSASNGPAVSGPGMLPPQTQPVFTECQPGSRSQPFGIGDPCPQTGTQCAMQGGEAVAECGTDGRWISCACEVSSDPLPTDPVPNDPVPIDPEPTDPVPTDPVPGEQYCGDLVYDIGESADCHACGAESCCDPYVACLGDPDCTCFVDCIGDSDPSVCVEICGLADVPEAFAEHLACVESNCPEQCPDFGL